MSDLRFLGHDLIFVSTKPAAGQLAELEERFSKLVAPEVTSRLSGIARLIGLIDSGTLGRDRTMLTLSQGPLAAAAGVTPEQLAEAALRIDCPTVLRRRGVEARLVIGERSRQPDPKLVSALGRAHRWLRALRDGRDITTLARADGISEGCLRVHLQLAFLAPAIQAAILDGTQPEGLTLHRLTRPEMPADWTVQYQRTGITPP